jgi:hypothetical protein
MDPVSSMEDQAAEDEAKTFFARQIGTSDITVHRASAGSEVFLKFAVGRDAPVYHHALRETQKALSRENQYRGVLGLSIEKTSKFPESIEASALLALLTRSTRAVAQDAGDRGFSVPYVPFQNREDYQLTQPATQIVVGRRGVGKSTLIRRAVELLRDSASIISVVDAQAYSMLRGDDLAREVLLDIIAGIANDSERASNVLQREIDTRDLQLTASQILSGHLSPAIAIPRLKRDFQVITRTTKQSIYVFLDDYHLLDNDEQPRLLHLLHGALKGANGWLKVAGLRSLLNYYSPATRQGLQVTGGDAQSISLDLTLENPSAAKNHLRAILERFMQAVGYSVSSAVLPEAAFTRLVWANAGVPRDFLQMFARAIEHARRNHRSTVVVSDVNVAIGEFGQAKIDEMGQDARNAEGDLRRMLQLLESYCLDESKTNAFLLRSEDCPERKLVHTLSDLRLVHLINQSTTPDRAGKRYEAFILDYSMFVGFRRRLNIAEMIPKDEQFKASELRKLPRVSPGFIGGREATG